MLHFATTAQRLLLPSWPKNLIQIQTQHASAHIRCVHLCMLVVHRWFPSVCSRSSRQLRAPWRCLVSLTCQWVIQFALLARAGADRGVAAEMRTSAVLEADDEVGERGIHQTLCQSKRRLDSPLGHCVRHRVVEPCVGKPLLNRLAKESQGTPIVIALLCVALRCIVLHCIDEVEKV